MLRGERKIATVDPHPGKVLLDRSPGLGVLLHLLEGLLGESLDAAHIEPTDGCQAKLDAGAVTTGPRHGDRRFQQRRRACRVAGVEVVDELGQAAMHAPPGMCRGLGVDGGAQERMGEPEPAAGSLQDACLLGAPHAGRCPVPSFRGRNDQFLRRAGRGRHDEETVGGTRRQRGKPCPQQFLEILRNGERFAGRRPDALAGEGPDDLEGEERVSLRDPV